MNLVVISGNLTKDPEFKEVKGLKVVNFNMGVYKGKDKSIFVHVVAYDKTAENCRERLHKGDKVEIVGYLDINTYKQENRVINSYYVVCNRFEMQSKKRETKTEDVPFINAKTIEAKEEDELTFP